jgi:hypothetical protein
MIGTTAHTVLANQLCVCWAFSYFDKNGGLTHSFKNRTGDRTGEAVGLGFHWSDRWFTGSMSGFLNIK